MTDCFVVEMADASQRMINAFAMGVSQTGDLLAYQVGNTGEPMLSEGLAAGTWKRFYKSTLARA